MPDRAGDRVSPAKSPERVTPRVSAFQPNRRVRVACTFRAVESVTDAQDLLSEHLPASCSLSFFFPHPLSDRTSPGQSTLARLSHPLSLLFYACARSSPFSSLHPPRPVPPRASVNMHATFALAALASVASVATAQKQFVPQEITTLTAAFAAGVNGYGRFPCTQVNGDGSFSPRKSRLVFLLLCTRPRLRLTTRRPQFPTTRATTSSRSPVARTTALTAATARPRLAPSASSRPRPAPTSAVSPALRARPTRTATTVSARAVSGTTGSLLRSLGLGADPESSSACSTGGFDQSCGGDNANCEGFLFCTTGDIPPVATASNTCGGVGSYCQSAYSPASSTGNATDANLIYNQYCASSKSTLLPSPVRRIA